MEATRKLVEEDQVLFIIGDLGHQHERGHPPVSELKEGPAVVRLLGRLSRDQPQEFPWTMGFLPTYQAEAHIYSQYLLENHPRSRIGVLYQDDGLGKDYLKGLKDGLGGYISSWPSRVQGDRSSIDAQLAKLKASNADFSSNSPRRNSPPWRSGDLPKSDGGHPFPRLGSQSIGGDSAGRPGKCRGPFVGLLPA